VRDRIIAGSTNDGVKARDPKAKTTSIKVKAKVVIHMTKDKAPKVKVKVF